MTKTELLGFYRQMRLIREFERESERQYAKGNIRGFLHAAARKPSQLAPFLPCGMKTTSLPTIGTTAMPWLEA